MELATCKPTFFLYDLGVGRGVWKTSTLCTTWILMKKVIDFKIFTLQDLNLMNLYNKDHYIMSPYIRNL